MPFNRPTLPDLIDRVKGDILGGLGVTTLLRRSFLLVMARVLAGLAHLLFGYLAWLEKQVFIDTTDDPAIIARWGAIWGVERKVATFSQFTATVTGQAGVDIPANKVYQLPNGIEFTVDDEVTMSGTTDTIELTCEVSGTQGAVEIGDVVTIQEPIANLQDGAVVASIVIKPEDLEDVEAYRNRILQRIRNPPSGGSATDYIAWALSVAGITRAWVAPLGLGPGTVVVYVVEDGEDPITPITAKLDEVAAYIETVRPVTATVTVVAPVLFDIDMTIKIKPNLTSVQDAIEAELKDMILRESQVNGTYKDALTIYDGKILLSHINEAISIADGEFDHEIVDINGVTPANVAPPTGNLAVLGTITWQILA